MAVRNIHHMGCVVEELEKGYAFWRDAVGLRLVREEERREEGLRLALLSIGNSFIELLQPLRPDSDVGQFLERTRIGGLHHVCFETDDVAAEMGALRERGVALLDGGARETFVGKSLFVAPAATQSVLVEVAEPRERTVIGGREEGAAFVELPIAVMQSGDLLGAARQWERNFGLQVESYLVAPEADNRHVIIPTGGPGGVYIEVITPLSETGKNAAYLHKVGDGLFQIGVRSADVDGAARRLNEAGYRVQQEEGMDQGRKATFVHPKSAGGVFIAVFPPGPIPSGPIP